MEYRKLKRGGEMISAIGLGAQIEAESVKEMAEAYELAIDNKINFFDLAAESPFNFEALGEAMKGVRKDIFIQFHFGTEYSKGEYGWTTDFETIKKSVDWQLKKLKTDYIDFGFIHCIDEHKDLDTVVENGTLDMIKELKKQGFIKHIALSSHTPEVAQRVLDWDLIDMLMFSINPGYDYKHGEYAIGATDERLQLYARCEREGVGISVMKPYSGGQLLNEATSPFGKALTDYQCLQYCLDTPGVLTVVPGVRSKDDIIRISKFYEALPEEKDYSFIKTIALKEMKGKCVYCNHCKPCPAGLDVGLINKYYDLAKAGDELAKNHYMTLEITAESCISCGHCNSRCPFGTDQVSRMAEIKMYFGK